MPAIALTVRRACFRIRHDEAAFFQWCWLLTSLVFLTICQSKIPSYAFYLFVPLAILVGKTLDDFLSNGFASNGERRMVLGTAVFQCAVVGIFAALTLTEPAIDPTSSWLANKAVSLNKTLRPFDAPILLVFAGLAASMVFFFLIPFSFQGVYGVEGMLAPGIVDGTGVGEALGAMAGGGLHEAAPAPPRPQGLVVG